MDLLVFQRNSQDIDTVIINGEIVMKKGNVLTVDEESAKDEVRRTMQRIWPEGKN
jgi:5-methylthioadenosine/S-adenosylhomocysteine deaminase